MKTFQEFLVTEDSIDEASDAERGSYHKGYSAFHQDKARLIRNKIKEQVTKNPQYDYSKQASAAGSHEHAAKSHADAHEAFTKGKASANSLAATAKRATVKASSRESAM